MGTAVRGGSEWEAGAEVWEEVVRMGSDSGLDRDHFRVRVSRPLDELPQIAAEEMIDAANVFRQERVAQHIWADIAVVDAVQSVEF